MPTMPFNDLTIHMRDNDLVLATHARGIWILDSLTAIQGLGAAATTDAQLFPIEPAEQIRYTNLKAHAGDMTFRGENPPNGAIVDYWLGSTAAAPVLTVHDASGTLVQTLAPTRAKGVNRVVWNLRHAELPVRAGFSDDDDAPRGGNMPGPYVTPGVYTVRMLVGGKTLEQKVTVKDDPRIDVLPADRKIWSDFQLQVAATIRQWGPVADKLQKGPSVDADIKRQARELTSRLSSLMGATGRWVGRPTADQQSEFTFYKEMVTKLTAAATGL